MSMPAVVCDGIEFYAPELKGVVVRRYTNTERQPSCDLCAAGECIQQVNEFANDTGTVVIHLRRRDLS